MLKLILVEDSQTDFELAVGAMRADGLQVDCRQVISEAGLRQALHEARPDLILSDFSMPGFDGLHALRIARDLVPRVPFIFLSGTIGEERAIEAIKQGATDYILKDNMRRLGTAVRRALAEAAERADHERRIEHHANFDPLTNLPNRRLLGDRASQAIAHARRSGRSCALIIVDIDAFKLVVDSYGHEAGDALLRALADRLLGVIRDGDTVARIGGDSFCVLATDLARPEDAVGVATKIRDACGRPMRVDERPLRVSVRSGISMFPRDGETFEVLLRNADAAVHRARKAGGIEFYASAMTQEITDRIELVAALRDALPNQQMEIHLQPQVALADGRVTAVEALLRWNHPQLGRVPPVRFIPIAEESGLIDTLGQWALEEGCRVVGDWDRAGCGRIRLAVNVSPRQFRSAGFVESVHRALQDTGLDPSRLELELTEGVFVEEQDAAIAILADLKSRGVSIAIDDFGTGYSSLSYLSRLPLDCLKIDRAFVRNVCGGGSDATIAKAVISLGHALGLRVIAEGVETPEQLAFLREHGCDEGQGYLFARPGPVDETAAMISAGTLATRMGWRRVRDSNPRALAG